MNALKIIKIILFCLLYTTNLLLAAGLWLCGQSGNIMLGILLIACYRLSLWTLPFAISVLCWLPTTPKRPLWKRVVFHAVHLVFCGLFFVTCFLLFGNWF